MFGQFGSKKNPCNMRFMHYHSMHYDNFYCTYQKVQKIGQGAQEYVIVEHAAARRPDRPVAWQREARHSTNPPHPSIDHAPLPTALNTSKLGKNIEQE